MISFTQEQIAAFDKAQCKALLSKFDGMLDDATKAALTARVEELVAPPAPTAFPKQDELTAAYEQWKAWGDVAKGLIAEAKAGNHTYTDNDGKTVQPKKARKVRDPNAAPRQRKVNTDGSPVERKSMSRPVIGGVEYSSFEQAARALGQVGNLPEDEIKARSWRRHLKITAGDVVFTDATAHDSFKQRMIDGATKDPATNKVKLPNWAGMEVWTLVHPVTGERWNLAD